MQSSKKILIIVESPGKIKKIQEYLGKNYIIKASCGHIRDLDKKTLSIDISNNMVPLYTINNDKIKIIADLKKYSNQVSQIMLATDADREGEAIAYSLAEVLKIKNPVRIIFNEITKSALLKAVDNPTTINDNIVKAQQTRRILDRLVGYMITPLLWKYIVNDASIQSTGRVQSAALQIIIDKENKINNHNFIKDYKVILNVSYLKNNIEEKLISTLEFIDKHESSSSTEEDKNTFTFFNEESKIYTFLNKINKFSIFKIVNKKGSTINKSPPYPYITSSLQQDAYTKLHFSIKKTMLMAQKLYENGLITYMRTDSPNISNTVINKIKDYIYENHGENYYKYRTYKSNNVQSQDAHECIRPTNVSLSNINLSTDENKLYNLIWKRTIASQMSDAKLLETKIYIDILNDNNSILIFNKSKAYFINTCTSIIFDGFLVLYNETSFREIDNIQLDTELSFNNINIFDEYKKMPMRYNEANLVKHLEKQGIGRPSTFVPTLTKLLDKKYIDIKDIEGIQKPIKTFILTNTLETKVSETSKIIGNESKKIVPTELGIEINKFIDKHFNELLNSPFSSISCITFNLILCLVSLFVIILGITI